MIGLVSYILTFTEGILTFISPCILPMLPIYFIYLAGASESRGTMGVTDSGGSGAVQGKSRILPNSLGFVIGFTIIFVLLGATVTSLGAFLKDHRLILQKMSGLVMVVFGLNFTGLIKLGFLNREKRMHLEIKRFNFFKSILFGLVFGLGWTPCLGAFLGSALLMASSSGTIIQGMLMLLVYSIGLGVPFIISAVIFENIKGVFVWLNHHGRIISIISGVLLIAAGLLIFFDILKYLG